MTPADDDVLEPPPYGPAPPGAQQRRWARRPGTDAEARALASGLRLQILRIVLDEPLTNKEIAVRLGRNPASVLHHVRTLVATGFLAPQPERRGARNAREVPYLATGKSFYLSLPRDSSGMLDAFVAEVSQAPAEQVDMGRMGVRLSREGVEELSRRLSALLTEYAEREPDPGGEPWSLFVALHLDVGRARPDAS